MAETKSERIRRLTNEMMPATARLASLDPSPTLMVSNITDQIVAGIGLLDTSSDATTSLRPAAEDSAANEQEEESDYECSTYSDDEEEGESDETFDAPPLLGYLRNIRGAIVEKHKPRSLSQVRGLKSHINPFPHQQRAAAVAVQAGETEFKGFILADPPGLGKTLPALMAIAAKFREGGGPSVVVAPLSCCRQWMSEMDS
ncbi:hypothetical protein QBC33DRAFT_565180 [Phialemonium atrogriseum]|uniref:SNF2 N-terminal domain-containing protein n=1 Tax=Phialemonium atrogriseum TaxID=1093897 RepID=A0AAJ0C9M5_9PEZI|nr:uncharacterized protein QBC33DRAFT_565180 [Phialemonium atrogriseum]KAK1772718.1 hypothetical protein QBC33DRAFT_565180 [Phialemonium atrogriseum]